MRGSWCLFNVSLWHLCFEVHTLGGEPSVLEFRQSFPAQQSSRIEVSPLLGIWSPELCFGAATDCLRDLRSRSPPHKEPRCCDSQSELFVTGDAIFFFFIL